MEFVATLEEAARAKIERETSRLTAGGASGGGSGGETYGECPLCPVLWVLRELVEMVAEDHERPVAQHTQRIRQLITEQEFVDENGDNVIDAHSHAHIETQIEVAVRVLEEVRLQALRDGLWSNAPVPSLMCG